VTNENGTAPEGSVPPTDLAAKLVDLQVTDPNDLAEALELAYDLIDHGVPVVVCKPNPEWTGGPDDVLPPKGWAVTTAEMTRPLLASFRPGVDTLAMVGGHGVDDVDADTKANGSVDNLPPFRYFGVHTTPSGGRHYLVRSTGIGKISPLNTSAGHVGDYVGGTTDGGSRMLAFLPGSTRRKYPGKGYGIEQRVDLDELFDCDPDDELASALIEANGSRDGKPGKQAVKLSEVRAWLARACHARHLHLRAHRHRPQARGGTDDTGWPPRLVRRRRHPDGGAGRSGVLFDRGLPRLDREAARNQAGGRH
jgi:hypothetical protein